MIQKLVTFQNFLISFILFLSSSSFSQTDQVTINNKQYYVYPHQQEVRVMTEYYLNFADSKEVIKRDERNEKIVSVTVEHISEKEKKLAPKFPKTSKKNLKQLEMLLENYSYFLVTAKNSISDDPTPALRNLPDGNYILFYRDIPYITKRVIRYKNDLVAATFSVKNNQIEGKSEWFNPEGKLVMVGNYLNSEKSGTWKEFVFREKYDQNTKYEPNQSIEERIKNAVYDTTITTTNFVNGLKNGLYTVYENSDLLTSGNYTNDQASGAWEYYEFKNNITVGKKGQLIVTKTTEKTPIDRYAFRADQKRGKSPMIRHQVVPPSFLDYSRKDSLILRNNSSSSTSNYSEYGYEMEFPDFSNFYSLLDKKDTANYELPEENLNSYEGEEYYEDEEIYFNDYEESMYGEENANYNPNEYYQFANKKRYTYNDLIDSIGYLFIYEGIVEHYYPNGQLQYKFEVKDGMLLKEEPVYWDNGTIANEIIFVPDSNQYVQRFYDYNGVKYFETWHDLKGNVLSAPEINSNSVAIIDSKKYERNYGQPTFLFADPNAIKGGQLSEKVLLIQELFKVDSSLAKQVYFYPSTRTVVSIGRNLMGDTVYQQEAIFSEDYLNVNATSTTTFKNITLKTIENGSLDDYWKSSMSDTVPIEKMAYYWDYKYIIEGDKELLVDGKPFTGDLRVNDKTGSFKLKASKESIQLTLPKSNSDLKLYKSALKSYSKSKKRSDLLIGYVSDFGGSSQLSHSVTRLFTQIYGSLQALYEVQPYELDRKEEYPDGEYDVPNPRKKGNSESVISSLQGKYLNGKPEGVWTYKDQFGQVRSTIGYKNGLAHGDNLDYSVANPLPKQKEEELYAQYQDPLSQFMEYPAKRTVYLDSKCTFKNGEMDGPYTTLNWKGDTLMYVSYINGAKEGVEYKRNKLFYSQAFYRNGYLDGNVQTYFTYPKKDSILIFDLGFKNGALQGESVAYHSNGKLAKKGFFLTGQPIDDYEAYDTLGFKYQYVKFQYSQPIEEKIWEENELSVRYEFDWRDSIPFNFSDITESSSIERLIYQAGYSDQGVLRPYYGRPSLVNKSGIDYYITKYYPNDTIARVGAISKGVKVGCWKYFNYEGKKLMEVEYFDTIISINDSIKFKSKGILYYLDKDNNALSKSWIIEKFEKYDCSHTDHNEERMLYCFWEKDTTQHRKNGYVKNYYDNGNLQNEGWVKDGLPTGVWKMYDVNGNLNQVGQYILGKRDGRWLKGDLGSVKNMSEICLNPNLENLEAILSYQEKLLDVSVITYQVGKELKRKYYGINMNNGEAPEGYFEDEMYYGE